MLKDTFHIPSAGLPLKSTKHVHTCTLYMIIVVHAYMYMYSVCTLVMYPLLLYIGVYELAVETWRPTGRRVVDRLRRFFVGGATELSDIGYITRPSDFEVISSFLSSCTVYMYRGVFIKLVVHPALYLADVCMCTSLTVYVN